MPFPFGKSQKTPAELVRSLKENLCQLEELEASESKKGDKLAEEISKSLASLKEALCGTAEKEPQMEAVAQLAQELYSTNLFVSLIGNLQRIDFEGKKDTVQLFNGAVRRQIGARSPTVEYISAHPQIVFMLLRGYESAEAAQSCGAMLRECLRHEPLARIVLFSEDFYCFFHYVALSVFDVASDAFASFKDLLTRHKVMCAEFLETNYNRVFTEYDKLLHSDNYVTKRQSLKLLGELLLDGHNFAIMMEYISQVENLKLMMNMLKDKRRSIQFEAFHVFKIFVANPNKSATVLDILLKNQSKLLEFLNRFQMDRADDEQFTNEKNYLIKQIKELKRPASPGDV
ncbi:calcium-binding protein 39-like [Paramormyrops kingsleyae]|uniref:Calcium binding protein 39, like 1 n=1 Tax=Paramormyrops kingsleyae TaxID=1676925 RepID=A0A3B3QW72_9TELE|nr:calcium-binding protein 39-like [Paramormyrops kingsleyae]XP_023700118.1 calcium-binding protein 39-like [Paramormyrops kingsleyae]XP_023700119.1 calcium-binding protein 39-like [Paramormyrops kingsleyae]XP_023700120.1 calcium-binding protein 39-like [Paramormyrops kingsleyae]